MSDTNPISPQSSPSESQATASPKAPEKNGDLNKETQPASRKLKAIVDGAEHEVDEAEVLKDYQKYKSADKKFQEAAQMRKQVDEFISNFQPYLESIANLKDDPWAVHKAAGIDYETIAYEYAVQKALKEQEDANSSPQEKELKAIKAELAELKKQKEAEQAERERQKTEAQQLQQRQAEMEAANSLDAEIFSAIDELKIKPTERMIARMAEEMLNHLDATGEPLSAKEALKRVRSEVSRFSPDELMSLLPEELVDALVNARSSKKVGKQMTTQKLDQKSNAPRDKIDEDLEKFFTKNK